MTGSPSQAQPVPRRSSAVKEATSTAKAKQAKPVAGKQSSAGRQVAVTNPQPWQQPVDGASLLKDIAQVFSRYVVLSPRMAEVVALFTLYTYVFPDTFVSPLLAIQSPLMRCGKTTLMELLSCLVSKPLLQANASTATVFRVIEHACPTLLLDEADRWLFGNKELYGVLNSGWRSGSASVMRCDKETYEVRKFSTWCPKVLALIGNLPETLADRSIVILMRRRAADEHVDRLSLPKVERSCRQLRSMAVRWALDHGAEVTAAAPPVPTELNDRAADNWRPLLAIADLVGAGALAREAAVTLASDPTHEDGAAVVLLADLREVFASEKRLSTDAILTALHNLPDRPWVEFSAGQPLTARGLATLLQPFGIKPTKWREGAKFGRGYEPRDLDDAWKRYLGG